MAYQKTSNNISSISSPLVDMINEGFKLMDYYVNQNRDGEIIIHGQPVSQHRIGCANYGDVLQTINALDEYFRQLSSLGMRKEMFDKLVKTYETLRLACEEVHSAIRR